MQNKYSYWYFQKALSLKFCEQIIQCGKEAHKIQASIGKKKKMSKKDLENTRDCKISFLNQHWIYKEIQPFIHAANESSGWNFDWDFTEECQFTEYSKGHFYQWHQDAWPVPYSDTSNKNLLGKNRKLSVTISLSDPKDYKGGELEFDLRDRVDGKPHYLKCKEILPKGSIVVFPSYVWHRVKPVTKGVRHSLVAWNCGKPFK